MGPDLRERPDPTVLGRRSADCYLHPELRPQPHPALGVLSACHLRDLPLRSSAELDVPLPAMGVCLLWGAVLGTVVAGTLEYDVAKALGFLPKLAIGLIEESAKLIVPLGFY